MLSACFWLYVVENSIMVEIERFELSTSAMRMQRSSQLSYIPGKMI
jgi:hypothetical protein